MPVTGQKPVGHLLVDADPTHGITVWECAECAALINDVSDHERWHEFIKREADHA